MSAVPGSPARWRRLLRRVRRGLVRALATLLVAIVLSALLLLLAPVRGGLLGLGLRLAARALPGELAAEGAAWPAPGTLIFTDLTWRTAATPGDTLVHLRELVLGLDVGALRGRDLVVDSLYVDAPLVDVPGLTALFPAAIDSGLAATDSSSLAPPPWPGPWLRPGALEFLPSATIARLRITLARGLLAPDLTLAGAELRARAELGAGREPELDVVHAAGSLRQGGAAPFRLDLDRLHLGTRFDAAGAWLHVDSLVAEVAAVGPPAVAERLRAGDPARVRATGRVRWRRPHLESDLDLTFDLPGAGFLAESWPDSLPAADFARVVGTLAVAADLVAAGRIGAELDLDLGPSTWLERGRLRAVADLDPESPAHGKVRLDTLELAASGLALRARGAYDAGRIDLDLIGEAVPSSPLLSALAPAVAAGLDALQPRAAADTLAGETPARLAAALTLAADVSRPDSVAGAVALDLTGTTGIRSGRLRAEASLDPADLWTAAVRLDTLDLDVSGLAARARGTYDGGRVDLELTCEAAASSPLLLALAPAAAAGLDALQPLADADTLAGETPARLVGALTLAADVSRPDSMAGAVVLDLTGTTGIRSGLLRGEASLDPADLRAAAVRLDTLDLDVAGLTLCGRGRADSGSVDLIVNAEVATPTPWLSLAGPQLEGAELSARLDLALTGTPGEPRVDLNLAGAFSGDPAQVPEFELALAGDPRAARLRLRAAGGLAVAGSLLADSLLVDAVWQPDVNDSLPLLMAVSAGRDRKRLALLAAAGSDTVARLRVDSLVVQAAGEQLALAAPFSVRLDTVRHRFHLSRAEFSGGPGTVSFAGARDGEAVTFTADADLTLTEAMLESLFPSPLWSRDGGVDLLLAGSVELGGTADQPRFGGHLGARMKPHRNDPDLGARLEFRLVEGDAGGLGADLQVTEAEQILLAGTLLWPGRADLVARTWHPAPGRRIRLELPRQTLGLARFDRLLPKEVSLEGGLTLGARAELPVRALAADRADSTASGGGALEGKLALDKLRIKLPNQSRMVLSMDCDLGGNPLDPTVTGRVTVESGFFRIPELPRNLHPTEGKALLWEVAAPDSGRTPAPLTGFEQRDWGAQEEAAAVEPYLPDLDVGVHLPGNLRIHGYGLNLEVAGDLQVRRGRSRKGIMGPSVQGEVRSVAGTLKFMNRMFDFTRGSIEFDGQVPPNPHLDLQLEARVSGTTIRLQVTGRADDPVTDLSSEPAMNEVDIVAFLLFGRSLNDLDGDQRGRMGQEDDPNQQLRENLAGLAVAFGTADLQNSVSSTLGVDMVEMGSDSKGGSTLSAGKFISPKILLKYNQSLEKSGTYFMTLEYSLTQVFKVLSTYGQGEEASGLEVMWIRRY